MPDFGLRDLLAWRGGIPPELHNPEHTARAMGDFYLCACSLINALLALQGVGPGGRAAATAAWLFNPFTAPISARSSGEALVTIMLLALLLALFKGAVLHLRELQDTPAHTA